MKGTMERCPDCGGGPVRPLGWRRTGRSGMERIKSRCRNCGSVTERQKEEIRW